MATTGSFFTLLYPLGLSMISAQTRSAFVARENRYPLFRIMPQAIKKPRTFFRRGFGSDDAIVRLRAHASRGPSGLCGFAGAFGGRDHERDLMGETSIDVNGFWTKNRSQQG
jgi:hypothetical protein